MSSLEYEYYLTKIRDYELSIGIRHIVQKQLSVHQNLIDVKTLKMFFFSLFSTEQVKRMVIFLYSIDIKSLLKSHNSCSLLRVVIQFIFIELIIDATIYN